MKPVDAVIDAEFSLDGTVAFRLFADQDQPTLTVPEQIASRVGDRILDDRLAPGERIPEQELADEFQVSRGPIREAIRILEREGLVTILPRRGAVVTDLNGDEVRELFEIRAGLLEIVARKSIARDDPELRVLMRACVARLREHSQETDDGGMYAETTYRFGLLAARRCGNRRLYKMLASLSLQTLRYSKLGLRAQTRRQRSLRLWRESLRAFEAGDADHYVKLTRQRIDDSGAEAGRHLSPEPGATEPAK